MKKLCFLHTRLLCYRFGWHWPSRQCIIGLSLLSPLGKWHDPSFDAKCQVCLILVQMKGEKNRSTDNKRSENLFKSWAKISEEVEYGLDTIVQNNEPCIVSLFHVLGSCTTESNINASMTEIQSRFSHLTWLDVFFYYVTNRPCSSIRTRRSSSTSLVENATMHTSQRISIDRKRSHPY